MYYVLALTLGLIIGLLVGIMRISTVFKKYLMYKENCSFYEAEQLIQKILKDYK